MQLLQDHICRSLVGVVSRFALRYLRRTMEVVQEMNYEDTDTVLYQKLYALGLIHIEGGTKLSEDEVHPQWQINGEESQNILNQVPPEEIQEDGVEMQEEQSRFHRNCGTQFTILLSCSKKCCCLNSRGFCKKYNQFHKDLTGKNFVKPVGSRGRDSPSGELEQTDGPIRDSPSGELEQPNDSNRDSPRGELERNPKSSKDSPSGEPESIGEGVAQRDSGVGIDGVTTKETHVTLDESDAEGLRKLRLNPDGEDVQFISESKTPKKSRQTTSSGAKNPLSIDEFDISNVEYSEELTQDDLARKAKREAEMAELLALRKRSKNRIDYLLSPLNPIDPCLIGNGKNSKQGNGQGSSRTTLRTT
ncbi:hypothetical protein GEMRC1_010586 [Eukaryota sp. GEM-RC1]